jgi:hypothetical protein
MKGITVNRRRIRGLLQRGARYKYSFALEKPSSTTAGSHHFVSGEPSAMGSSRRGGHPELQLRLVHRLLALASLLLLASGEVIFEERFEGESDSAQFLSSV